MRSLGLMALVLLAASGTGAEPASATHFFTNQKGSQMQYRLGPGGSISGSYISAVGCGVGVERRLVGWINGSAITFTVSFGECGSATSWVGHIDDAGVISGIWTLARGRDNDWNAMLTGSSVFKPDPAGGAQRVR